MKTLTRAFPRGLAGRKASQGFTLIEVLIAILVLGFGLLAFALMQSMTLRFAQSSHHRTIATNLAYEMVDSMRANRVLASQYPGLASAGPSTAASCGVGANMSPAENVGRWLCQLGASLPEGDGQITLAGGQVTVTVTWTDAGRWQDGAPPGVVTVVSQL